MSRDLDFERPVLELERQIEELRRLGVVRPARTSKKDKAFANGAELEAQIEVLEQRAKQLKEQIFSNLTRWQIVQVARHPQRPYTLDYIRGSFSDFIELHGDRHFADDPSIVGGLARLRGEVVMVIGHQKGRTTNENVSRNFGMPRPEGYHKALRLMQLADQFQRPIVTLIDTPGAYPGIDAEERGQARAIAEALEGMAALSVPVISVVIGEGGSGGALAIGVANRVLMLEYAIYSVISPEGCASILFKDASYAARAADAMKLTAPDLRELGVVDEVIPEGLGGAHRDPEHTAERVQEAVHRHLIELKRRSPEMLREDRYRRFRFIGSLSRPEERRTREEKRSSKRPAKSSDD
jgi:acetyl-CoA carboxylase carboxyl transferase subunit alpha